MHHPVPAPALLRRQLARRGFHSPRVTRSTPLAVVAIVAFALLVGDR